MPRFELRDASRFWEVEVVGDAVETCEGSPDATSPPKIRSKPHDNEDEARYAAGRLMAKQLRRGFKRVGDARFAGGGSGLAPPPAASAIALEEYFTAGDAQFLTEVMRSNAASKLANLAPRWYQDKRPWARQALLQYIDDGCDRPLHKGLVKRLFKLAESSADDEAMAHFMVAFDRLLHRALIKQRNYGGWDPVKREYRWDEKMVLVHDPSVPGRLVQAAPSGRRARRWRNPQTGRPAQPGTKPAAREHPQFSRATRRYLARRAYRYFRMLGHRDPARYGKAMRIALPLYTDASLSSVSKLLDAWGLLHALYAWSPVLLRAPSGVRLADGKSLGDLGPAPHFPAAWQGVFDEMLGLATAPSRTVRAWAIGMLRAHYGTQLGQLGFAQVKRLLQSEHEEPLVLGAELLAKLRGLETLPLPEWLELLALDNLDVLTGVAMLAEKYLSPARLGLDQCVELACAKAAPVARLGLKWARTKPVTTADALRAIARLARAGVATVRDEGTRWAVDTIAAHPLATPEHVRDLCDGPYADARTHALAVVGGNDRFAAQPALWFALTESPYDDVRAFVLRNATRWRAEASPTTLRHVWTTAVLQIHRGSTAKARVPRQIAERIASHPDEARALLPVLGLSLRSVRPAERALALGALARAVRGDDTLRALAGELLPELSVSAQVTA